MRFSSVLLVLAAQFAGGMLSSAAGGPAAPAAVNAVNGQWIAQPSSARPAPRMYATAIYDSLRDRVIVFGGLAPLRADAWELRLSGAVGWHSLAPSGPGPSPRWGMAAIFDAARDRIVVFGGMTESGVETNEVWALSLAEPMQWSQLAPTGAPPAPRRNLGAIYDPVRDRMVIFGGARMTGAVSDSFYADTWALSFAGTPTWARLLPSISPSPRVGMAAVYDRESDRMVIACGSRDTTHLGDVWALSLATAAAWTNLSPASGPTPAKRMDGAAVFDPVRRRMVMFGGSYGGFLNDFGDAWALSLPATGPSQWNQILPGGGPSPRHGESAIYDARRDRMLVCGGYDHDYLSDAWTLSFAVPSWQEMLPVPPARFGSAAVLDGARDRMVVFGGQNSDSTLSDVWALSMDSTKVWSRLPVAPSVSRPGARAYAQVTYDAPRQRMIIFGGYGSHHPGDVPADLADVFALSLGAGTASWSEISPAGTPPDGRLLGATIFDPLRQRLIVFGGAPARLGDLWSLNLTGTPAWTELTPLGTPPSPRFGATAIYDPRRDRMLMFGGDVGLYDGDSSNEVWALALAGTPTWTLLAPFGPPPSPRRVLASIYDGVRDRVVMFGGGNDRLLVPALLNESWQLSMVDNLFWLPLAPQGVLPVSRSAPVAVYDSTRGQMVVFGGWDGAAPLGDAWTLMWDTTTPVAVALIEAHAGAGGVRLAWSIPDAVGTSVSVERREADTVWGRVGTASVDGVGRAQFDDASVVNGHRYGYRPTLAGSPLAGGEAWVDVPQAAQFALERIAPNPGGRALEVRFSLSGDAPAALECVDLTGRRVARRELGAAGAGPHALRIELPVSTASGIYFLRLTEGSESRTTRVCIVR